MLNTVGTITYYAQNKIGTCVSTSRTAVALEIKDSPFLSVTNKFCSLDLLTYSVSFNVASGSTITRSPAVGTHIWQYNNRNSIRVQVLILQQIKEMDV